MDRTDSSPPRASRLSKSRFTAGLQCYRQLWWRAHEPDSPELVPDETQQAIFDQGSRVGAIARTYVPGGILIDAPYYEHERRLELTHQALRAGAPVIYEAAVEADGVFVAVDILERRGDAFHLIEVKSSTKVKDEHLPDIAVQLHVLRRSGLDVPRAVVMHLNRACRYPRLDNLFTRVDVTREAEALLEQIPPEIERQLQMLAGALPVVAIGRHCDVPYTCPFKSRCWVNVPQHHVRELYRIGLGATELVQAGFITIDQIPESIRFNAIAERQRRALREGRRIVERGLRKAMGSLGPPLLHLDFETVMPAIPVWDRCRPYDAIPVQLSVHRIESDGSLHHTAWLAEGGADPRPACAQQLIAACTGAGPIVAYNAPFERECIRALADAIPERAKELRRIERRLVDALPWVRDYIYDPAFHGGFGLKQVLPVLVPGLDYSDLEIADGATASFELHRLLLEPERIGAEERFRLRRALLAYCERDTLATVKLVERLRELAG
jgi:hypothetical protein